MTRPAPMSEAGGAGMTARLLRALRPLSGLPGWGRLADRLVPRARRAEFVVSNNGLRFRGDLSSHIDRQVYLFGGYEEARIAAFLALIPPERRQVALDVGANVGTHALRFAQHFREVHAFEPNPTVFSQLERNIALNDLPVTAHQVGLADRESELDFYLTEHANSGLGTFSPAHQYDVALRIAGRARVVPADAYLQRRTGGRIDAVKLDTQGFEPEALRGMQTLLSEHRPYVWFEIGGATIEQLGNREALAKLLPFQFRLHRFEKAGRNREVLALTDRVGRGNFIAEPLGDASA